jgi:predicted ester cyclase
MSAEVNKMLHRRYVEEFNRRNAAYLDEYFAPGCVYHGAGGDLDVAGFKAQQQGLLAAFPDTRLSLDDSVAEGDRVASRFTIRATHTGELQGIPPTGRQVTITAIIISRFEDGRAVEEWESMDMLGLMQQIGAIPAAEA